jgi:glycine/D-amino acid oxidase-like deaminating enzyme
VRATIGSRGIKLNQPRQMNMDNGRISYWRSRLDVVGPDLPTVDVNLDVDVAIVGAGLTGLWTAATLKMLEPSLEVAVFEAEDLGFGASGRNGGWLSAKPVGMRPVLARMPAGLPGVRAADRILAASIHEVVNLLGAANIDAKLTGWMEVARTQSEVARINHYLENSRSWDIGSDRLRLLSADEATERVRVAGALGALFSPDCYRVDPFKMLLALTEMALNVGVQIYARSRVEGVYPGRLRVRDFDVKAAKQIVIATEGYSRWERGQKRRLLPMNSAMIVTEQLTDTEWADVGWEGAECLGGAAHTFFYAQRTADGRVAIGGRVKPYRFASGVDDNGQVDQETVDALTAVLSDIFPQVGVEPIHAWCGVLGVSRDWSPFVDQDKSSNVIHVGGYAGQGLTASYVAGATVADLITGRDTELTALPWVRRMSRRWEPEPFRWIGANGLYKAYSLADRIEARSGVAETAWPARVADKIAGR